MKRSIFSLAMSQQLQKECSDNGATSSLAELHQNARAVMLNFAAQSLSPHEYHCMGMVTNPDADSCYLPRQAAPCQIQALGRRSCCHGQPTVQCQVQPRQSLTQQEQSRPPDAQGQVKRSA